MKKYRSAFLATFALLACGAIAVSAGAHADVTDDTSQASLRAGEFMQVTGTAAKDTPCVTDNMLARTSDGSGFLTCTDGKWTAPVNHTFTAEFTYLGKPFAREGFPSVVASFGPSSTGSEHDIGYALCVNGGLKSMNASVGWHYSVRPMAADQVEVLASAQAFDPSTKLPANGCVHSPVQLRRAEWATAVKLKVGESVTLDERNGFTVKITRGNDLPD